VAKGGATDTPGEWRFDRTSRVEMRFGKLRGDAYTSCLLVRSPAVTQSFFLVLVFMLAPVLVGGERIGSFGRQESYDRQRKVR